MKVEGSICRISFCYELNEMSRPAQKSHVYQPPPQWGGVESQFKKKVFCSEWNEISRSVQESHVSGVQLPKKVFFAPIENENKTAD